MIRSIGHWLCVVRPPWWTVALYILGQALCVWTYILYVWLADMREAEEPVLLMRRYMAAAACICFGIYRCYGFHPLFSTSYRNWLETTPWTAEKRLPLGPPHLVAQDLVLLGLVWLLLLDPTCGYWIVPMAFLGPYLAMLGGSLWVTGETKTAWVLAFLAALAGGVARWPAASLALVALAIYPLAYLGLRRSLARFPWAEERERYRKLTQGASARPDRGKVLVGWSYELLSPKFPRDAFSRVDRLLLGPLLGCATAAGALNASEAYMAEEPLYTALLATWIACVSSRLVAYNFRYWPPISLWGRIRTGCWIIPGYDKVFAAPLTVCVIGALGATLSQEAGVAPILVIPACVAGMILVALNMGPSLVNWRLTGRHRIVAGHVENSMVGRV